MKRVRILPIIALSLLFISCDPNHTAEFNRIDRNDIAGYEQFIATYPNSTLVADARERIEVAKEDMRLLEEADMGTTPYRTVLSHMLHGMERINISTTIHHILKYR